jgi:hypothetical protein
MKAYYLLFLILLTALTLGCSEKSSVKEEITKKPPEPEETIRKYVFYYNMHCTDCIYDLLSSKTRKNVSDVYLHNMLIPLMRYYSIEKWKVIDKKVYDNNTAILKLEVVWVDNLYGIWISRNETVKLILEDGEWKMIGWIIIG